MQTIRCRWLAVAVVALGALAAGCVKEISSDERLDRETQSTPIEQSKSAAEIESIRCEQGVEQLAQARDVNRPEEDRLNDYMAVYSDFVAKTKKFEEAMNRDPDLQYREGAQKYADAREVCIQQTADIRVEFERYVRDLVDVPTVTEFKGSREIVAPRLSFDVLRKAIEALSPDDREQLLGRVANAEKRLAPPEGDGKKRKGK